MRIELRADSIILDGYVNVTLRESRVLPSPKGRFVEEIIPRTFERALMKNDSVDLLFNHDHNRKLGSTKSGELELREDNVGLRAIATVTDKEVMEKAKKGELRGWSFGFSVLQDAWKQREDGMQKRSVSEIDLFEVSILDKTPAYIATSIEQRGEEDSILTETRSEEFEARVEDKTKKTKEKPKDEEEDEEEIDQEEKTGEEDEDKTKKTKNKAKKAEETKKQEENREAPESHYFEHLEKEVTLLQIKGGF